jgi:aryl-alcohol dehydrogenase-like predicted oxidoreductase
MEYTQLGRTGLKVSRLVLGTMNFGPHTPEPEAFKIMDRALEHGINFFDTANLYGQWGGTGKAGASEEIIGRWLAQGNGRREKIVLASKVFCSMPGEEVWPNREGLSAYHIRQACEDSLRRLQTDHLDLYQMHHIDRATPWEEIWQALGRLVDQGSITYAGSSNFPGWTIARANEIARSRHFLGLVSEQSLYNLNSRTIELEVIPACQAYGMALIPYSPLDRGLLGGVLQRLNEGKRRASDEIRGKAEANHDKLTAYESLCAEIGERPSDVAMAWLLHRPGVTAPIVGPRTVEQLDNAIHATTIALDAEIMGRLDAIFPGPGGAAPEAYAW